MSYFTKLTLENYGLGVADAFGRARMSEPFTLFDSKLDKDNLPLLWDESVDHTGSGTSAAYSKNEAAVTFGVSNATAGKVIRQTFQRFNYQPGKSQLIFLTGVLGQTTSGIISQIGYFDDNDGLFFSHEEGVAKVNTKSNVTGTPVTTSINQSAWSLDRMDGAGGASNPSGVTLDFTKTQIFVIDFEWLGVGNVRYGFVIAGKIIYVHEQDYANSAEDVYMSTAVLPIRYSLENTGAGAAFSQTKQICSTVISEGGTNSFGILRHSETGDDPVDANAVGTQYALLGIKLQTTKLNSVVDLVNASILATTADDYEWHLIINPTVAGGGLTYSDLPNSSIQVGLPDTTSGGASDTTVTGGTTLDGAYASGSSTISEELNNSVRLGAFIDGTPNEIVLVVSPLSSNLDIRGSLTWREL
jgi:hypothetical protein